MAFVLPVVSSAVQPSKAARRRARHRHTAVVHAQCNSLRISECLKVHRPDEVHCEASDGTCHIEVLLRRLEVKVDSVIQFLCRPTIYGNCVASSWVTDFGVPAEKLREECNAALVIQRAWKRRLSLRASHVPLEGSRTISANRVQELCIDEPMGAQCFPPDMVRTPQAECAYAASCGVSSCLPFQQQVEQEATTSFESPWHFLLPEDCAHASVTCKVAWETVAQSTPIGDQYLESQDGDAELVSVKNPTYDHDDDGADGGDDYDYFEDGLDAEELEELYQTALRECPGNHEQMFQQLLKERLQQ